MRQYKRMTAGLMAGLLCMSLLPFGAAAAGESPLPVGEISQVTGENATLSIRSVKDLMEFSRQCTLDSWSRGRTILLEADLDLTGTGFLPIPAFQGTFDGQGHTISGLSLTAKGSRQGLFRVVEAGALIQNLRVEGTVFPGGSKNSLGLLAGENEGTIQNCQAVGNVEGRTDVGGLVGLNTGVLESCLAEVTVAGQQNIGGLCGRSTGTIQNSVVRGEVNTKTPNDHVTDPIQNIGGVAGLSQGTVTGCMNEAQVGYPHVGYNVGGIVGRYTGSLSSCSNSGEIHGRKGVGGIVGRFTPDMELVYGHDPVETLNSSLIDLSSSLLTFSNQLSDTVDRGVGRVEGMNDELGALRDTTSQGLDQQADYAREALDNIYERLQSINDSTSLIHGSFDVFFEDSNRQLDQLIEDGDKLRDAIDQLADAVEDGLNDAADTMRRSSENLSEDLSQAQNAMNDMASQLDLIKHVMDQCSAIIHGDGGPLHKLQALKKALDQLRGLDFGGSLREVGAALGDAGRDMEDLFAGLERVQDNANAKAEKARDAVNDAADRISGDLKALNNSYQKVTEEVNDQLQSVNVDVDAVEDILKEWGNQADEDGTATSDKIDQHLDNIQSQVDAMTQGVSDSNQEIHATANTIIHQMDRVREAAHDLTEKPSRSLDDRSAGGGLDSGYLRASRSIGGVNGDADVGGIVGVVSFQISQDPEENLDWEEEEERHILADVTAVVRGGVEQCRNDGPVTARNECAGGIVGRLDLGAVTDGVNTGDVTVENASFCGGIAGYSGRGTVLRSSARCLLTGVDDVGGITGQGGDLTACRAMVTVDAEGERLGSISGWTEGELADNYALAEGLGAVDQIDLDGQARCLDYQSFAALAGLPEEFLQFELSFVADGKKIGALPFAYGGSVAEGDIPAVPQKEGFYAHWEEFSTQNLLRSRVIEAVYTPWDSTISSGGSRAELLAEGSFSPDAGIEVTPWTPETVPEGRELRAGWHYAIQDPEREVQPTVRLRVLAESGGTYAAVALLKDGELTIIKDAQREGSYLVFEAPSQGDVVILSGSVVPLVLLIVGGVLLLLLVVVLILNRKRRRRQKAAKGAVQEAAAQILNEAKDKKAADEALASQEAGGASKE